MEEDQVEVCASQRSHFEHKDEFLTLVERIVSGSNSVEAIQQIAVIVISVTVYNVTLLSLFFIA